MNNTEERVIKKRRTPPGGLSRRNVNIPIDHGFFSMEGVEQRAEQAKKASMARKKRKVSRTHPATSDKEYDPGHLEFMMAMEQYKKDTGNKYPSEIEAFHVLLGLGYYRDVNPGQG